MSVQDTCQAMKFLIFFKFKFLFKKFKNCHVLVYHRAMWQLTIMTRDNGNSCFQFSPLFKFLVQFSTLFFKMIQFRPFIFETKLVTKFNYNLYVKINVLNLYIKSLHLNIQVILFFTSVKNYKGKKCKK